MEIRTAMHVMGVCDIASESLESLKKIYRAKSKIAHPDNATGSYEAMGALNSAYETLKKLKETGRSGVDIPKTVSTGILTIEIGQLVNILKGKPVTSLKGRIITAEDLSKGLVHVKTNIVYWLSSKDGTESIEGELKIFKRETKDFYTIEKDISSKSEEINVQISLAGQTQEKKCKRWVRTAFRFDLGCRVIVEIIVFLRKDDTEE